MGNAGQELSLSLLEPVPLRELRCAGLILASILISDSRQMLKTETPTSWLAASVRKAISSSANGWRISADESPGRIASSKPEAQPCIKHCFAWQFGVRCHWVQVVVFVQSVEHAEREIPAVSRKAITHEKVQLLK